MDGGDPTGAPGRTGVKPSHGLPLAVAGVALLSLLFAATALGAVGGLKQKPGTAGCVVETGTAGVCDGGTALEGASSITVSPDGNSAYVTSFTSHAIAIFDRDSSGALTQKPGTAGCISFDGTGGACRVGPGLQGATSVVISPDGASVYVVSFLSSAIAIFDRNTATGTT